MPSVAQKKMPGSRKTWKPKTSETKISATWLITRAESQLYATKRIGLGWPVAFDTYSRFCSGIPLGKHVSALALNAKTRTAQRPGPQTWANHRNFCKDQSETNIDKWVCCLQLVRCFQIDQDKCDLSKENTTFRRTPNYCIWHNSDPLCHVDSQRFFRFVFAPIPAPERRIFRWTVLLRPFYDLHFSRVLWFLLSVSESLG